MNNCQNSLVTLDLLGRSSCLHYQDNANQFPSIRNSGSSPVAMSLRTRERSSIALKRIFEQIYSNSGDVGSVVDQLGFVPDKTSQLIDIKKPADIRRSVGRTCAAQETSSKEELRDPDMALQQPRGMDNLPNQHPSDRFSVSIDDAKRSSGYIDDMDAPKPPAVSFCTKSSIDNVQMQQHMLASLSRPTAYDSQLSYPSVRDSCQRIPLMPAQQFMHTTFPKQQLNRVPPTACGLSRLGDTVQQSTTQLTIFYAGNVNVYEDMPAETAHAIMLLAGSANSSSSHSSASNELSVSSNSGNASSEPTHAVTTAFNATMETATETAVSNPMYSAAPTLNLRSSTSLSAPVLPTTSHADVPFARKASLARFLEKRR
eukprot:c29344_g2_i2 orf=99-1214(+)